DGYHIAYTVDELLSDVKYAIERLEIHYRNLATGIVESCPAIKTEQIADAQGGYWVSCPEIGIHVLERVTTAKALFEHVQELHEEYTARQKRRGEVTPDPCDEGQAL
ncbi:MAG TPA: hypothetical protein VH593_15215, partial [Ktedonobacteraceae bacterium]